MSDKFGIIADLPESWVWTTLGEICLSSQYGWTTSASKQGDLHLLRTTDITQGNINWSLVPFCQNNPPDVEKYLLYDGDILISRAGSVGYSYLIRNPKKAVFASYLIRFRPLIEGRYLSFFLKSPNYWKSISEKSIGIALANVNASKLRQIVVPLPPLPEQSRIADKIETLFSFLDAGVESLRKVQVQLKRYRQAVLKYAFEGKLTEEWRLTHKEQTFTQRILENSERATTEQLTKLPNLPERWRWVKLSEIGTLDRGKSKHRPRDDPKLFGGNYPFIQTGDVRNSKGPITDFSQTYNELGLKQSKMWKANTLCITIAANIAETAFLGIDACFPDSIVGFIADKELCEVKYVNFFIKSIKDQLASYAPATAQKNINLAILRNLAVPLAPKPEQRKIVEEIERVFSVANKIEEMIAVNDKLSARLRQSILKNAFDGQLVPQDPSDESAEKLLDRIKAERNNKKSENGNCLELSHYVK